MQEKNKLLVDLCKESALCEYRTNATYHKAIRGTSQQQFTNRMIKVGYVKIFCSTFIYKINPEVYGLRGWEYRNRLQVGWAYVPDHYHCSVDDAAAIDHYPLRTPNEQKEVVERILDQLSFEELFSNYDSEDPVPNGNGDGEDPVPNLD